MKRVAKQFTGSFPFHNYGAPGGEEGAAGAAPGKGGAGRRVRGAGRKAASATHEGDGALWRRVFRLHCTGTARLAGQVRLPPQSHVTPPRIGLTPGQMPVGVSGRNAACCAVSVLRGSLRLWARARA